MSEELKVYGLSSHIKSLNIPATDLSTPTDFSTFIDAYRRLGINLVVAHSDYKKYWPQSVSEEKYPDGLLCIDLSHQEMPCAAYVTTSEKFVGDCQTSDAYSLIWFTLDGSFIEQSFWGGDDEE